MVEGSPDAFACTCLHQGVGQISSAVTAATSLAGLHHTAASATVVKYRRAQQEKQKLWSERTPPSEVFVLTCFEALVRIWRLLEDSSWWEATGKRLLAHFQSIPSTLLHGDRGSCWRVSGYRLQNWMTSVSEVWDEKDQVQVLVEYEAVLVQLSFRRHAVVFKWPCRGNEHIYVVI